MNKLLTMFLFSCLLFAQQTLEIREISPTTSAQGVKNLVIIIKGTGFVENSKIYFQPLEGIKINSFDFRTNELVIVNIDIEDMASVGDRSIIIENPDGSKISKENIFKINQKPIIENISPNSYSQGVSNRVVNVFGSGFVPTSEVTFIPQEGIKINSVKTESNSLILVNLTIDPNTQIGSRSVMIENPDKGRIIKDGIFNINPKPSIERITPNFSLQGTSKKLTIKGSGFVEKTAINFTPSNGIKISSVNFISDQFLSLNVYVDEKARGGFRDIILSNPDGGVAVLEKGFLISIKPSIKAIEPNCLSQGVKKQTISITGEGFTEKTEVLFQPPEGINIEVLKFENPTLLTLTVTINEKAEAKERNIVLQNPDGGKTIKTNAFKVNPKPIITGANPRLLSPGLNVEEFVISGENFLDGCNVNFPLGKIKINSLRFISPNTLSLNVSVLKVAEPGPETILITNPDKGECVAVEMLWVCKLDKNLVCYGNTDEYSKPAIADVEKIINELKKVEKKDLKGAKYWLWIEKFNARFREACKKIQERSGYDLIGKPGYIIDSKGEQISLPDITQEILEELQQKPKKK